MNLRPALAVGFLALLATTAVASAQNRKPDATANECLVWTSNSLLANPYFMVAKNVCAFAIQIEYRYETDVGTGCFGASACTSILQPSEIRRFTAGDIRHWACRLPAMPRFPDIARDGWCE